MAKKKKWSLVHINVTDDQKFNMDEMGGPTEAFRKLYAFWYQNYELWEEQERRKIDIKKRLNGLK